MNVNDDFFEERYIQLVSDCMKEQRLFGMIQPKIKSGQKPEVYRVGSFLLISCLF